MVLERISPIYYPSEAKNHIIFSNNLFSDGTYANYDSYTTVTLPTEFTYKKTSNYSNSYNFTLKDVKFSGNIGTSTWSPTYGSNVAEGKITLSKFTAKSDGTKPTIELYFDCNVIKNNITFTPRFNGSGTSVDKPKSVTATGLSYSLSKKRFLSDSNITGSWETNSGTKKITFSPAGFTFGNIYYKYQYEGDAVTISNNWNNVTKFSNESNGSFSFTPSDIKTLNKIPRVYCNWEILWGYVCSPDACDDCDYCDDCYDCGGDDCPDCDDGGGSGWPKNGTFTGGYNVWSSPGGGTYIGGPQAGVSCQVWDEQAGYYEVTFETYNSQGEWEEFSGWIAKAGVNLS